jgi:hypothetical protein
VREPGRAGGELTGRGTRQGAIASPSCLLVVAVSPSQELLLVAVAGEAARLWRGEGSQAGRRRAVATGEACGRVVSSGACGGHRREAEAEAEAEADASCECRTGWNARDGDSLGQYVVSGLGCAETWAETSPI